MLSSVSLPFPLSYRHLVQTTIDFFSSQPALREKLQSMMSLSNTQVRMLSFYLALTSNTIGREPTRLGSHWYHRSPYAIKNQQGASRRLWLVPYGIRLVA